MRIARTQTIVAALIFVASMTAASAIFVPVHGRPSPQDTNADRPDSSIKPGDDFYHYANGPWIRTNMAAGRTSYDNRALLTERTSERVRNLIQQAAAAHVSTDSITQHVGDYYASLMDEDAIEAKGLTSLAAEMQAISAITSKAALSSYLGSTLNTESEGLTGNADHIFGLWVNQGFEDSKHNFAHILQGGLGMPERDDYLDPSAKGVESRSKYQLHVAKMLTLADIANSEAKASTILSLEIQIAKAFAPDADAADVFKQNNPWKRPDFDSKAPGMDWGAYFEAAGLTAQTNFIVWQPTAVTGISALVGQESIDHWKDYLTLHLIEHYAIALPKALSSEHVAFTGQVASREQVAIAATNAALGQDVGQLYTRSYFPQPAKAKAQAMARDLITAYRARIAKLGWMTPSTKQKALAKLDAFTIGVGYPDKWIDYSTLHVVRADALGNMRRAEAFNRSRNLSQLRGPADPGEWRIDPQTVGAVIVFSPNSEFFSAGILQPPYFDPEGDAASNYGSAGAGMAHEITHSFDQLGNIYDAEGRLGMWWTDADQVNYRAATATLVAQFAAYCPFSDLCVDGNRTLNESAADLAGLLVAHDAYLLSLKGKTDVVIAGFTGEQRFFLTFAQRWRKTQSEAGLRKQITSDTHAPSEYRSDTVRNIDAWYKAFSVTPSDKLYTKPENRPAIW